MHHREELLATPTTNNATEMTAQAVEDMLSHFDDWQLLEDEDHGYEIKREYQLKTSQDAVAFINRLKKIAAEQHHFPDLHILGTQVEVTCYTEAINGMHLNDFIMAAHADDLFERWQKRASIIA